MGKKLMSLKLGIGETMFFRRDVPDSDMDCTIDIWQIHLCQLKIFKTEVMPPIMQKTK